MDVRYGLRQLRKNPAFTAVAVLTLALGIGASSTVFSIVDQLFLRPWPVKDPARLAVVFTDSLYHGSSYPDYLDIRNEVSAFSDVVAYAWRGGIISGEGRGEFVDVQVVSQNYFAALGVKTALGRTFSPQPDQAAAEGHSVVVRRTAATASPRSCSAARRSRSSRTPRSRCSSIAEPRGDAPGVPSVTIASKEDTRRTSFSPRGRPPDRPPTDAAACAALAPLGAAVRCREAPASRRRRRGC